MKRGTLSLFAVSLLASCVLTWNTSGEDFSVKDPVACARTPWEGVRQGNENPELKQSCSVRDGGQEIPIEPSAMAILPENF